MISLFPVRKALYLLLLLVAAPGLGSAQQGSREVMADAMSQMMEAMGLFDSASSDPESFGSPLGSPGWGSALGTPWGGPVRDRSRLPPMQELMRQFAGKMRRPGESGGWKPSRLEGIWEGRNGELLIVQGSRFRIYSPGMQQLDGLMQIRGDRLALYNPVDQQAQPFEFAESQGRLVMRGLAGQIHLYRRLRLDGR